MFRGNILLIDKFNGMNTLIAGYLTASGFQVDCMRSPQELTDQKLTTAHLALLDIGTAGNGLRDILERLNAAGVPAVVLTSEQDMSGRLTALEMGAADVMSRPLDMAELVARIRSAQSRTLLASPFANHPPVSFGGLTADIVKYRVTLDGDLLSLPPKEISLIYLLIGNPDRVFSREELSRQLGSSGSCTDRTVNMYISRLKKAIGRYSDNIVSVRSVGYKFTGEER